MKRARSGFRPVFLVGLLLSPEAVAQAPRGEGGRFEVTGLDFRPDGAWRRRGNQVRATRQDLLRAGQFGALNAPLETAPSVRLAGDPAAAALTGIFHVPVALIAYSNVPVAHPVADFQSLLFDPAPPWQRPYTLKTFYEELSNGLIELNGRVFAPARMDTTAEYYEDGCNGIGVLTNCPHGGARFGQLLLATLDSISNRPGGDTVWNQFDNDGPDGLPNSGDDDGVVDFVAFLQPAQDGACRPSPGIWAHRFVLRAWNGGSRYVTKTPRRGPDGVPIPGRFLEVDDYIIQSQVGGGTGCAASQIMPVGTIAHETGHAFGLPDLYDTDPSSRTEGIGHWGLMGSGNYASPHSPSSYEAWSLAELGWVTLVELTDSRPVTTGARQLTDTVFVARSEQAPDYVLVENRQAALSDTAQMNPLFMPRKLPGLLIWLIDPPRIAEGRPSNRVNTGARQGVSLMQADGLNQLRTAGARNRGDTGDSYPGSSRNDRFTLSSNPAARTNLNSYLGFVIDRIEQLAGQVMRFRFLRRDPSVFASGAAGAEIRVNGSATTRFEDVIPPGDPVSLEVDSVQTTPDGRTRVTFLTWSNGGPRTQTLVSGSTPDTVTASFAAEHRVLVTVQGVGAVTTSGQGDPALGFFVSQGAGITLTAAPPAGVLFAGWEGDTTSRNPVLALQVRRPYSLSAVFVTEQAIPEESVTAHLLGQEILSPDQRTYLDRLGNRNGAFDLGDYLAYLRREGLVPNPAVLTRLGNRRGGRDR